MEQSPHTALSAPRGHTNKEDEFGIHKDWNNELFEDEICSSLISLYESKLTRQKYNHPSCRITDTELLRARKFGLYIPNQNRLILDGQFDHFYDLPSQAGLSINISKRKFSAFEIKGYRANLFMNKVNSLPKHHVRTGGGQLYQLVKMIPNLDGKVDGNVSYLSVQKDGGVFPCDIRMGNSSMKKEEPHILQEHSEIAPIILNYEVDKSHCWTIEAQESEAKCVVGVDREQVKSLLYARTLPVSATGRKRPILHLVAAHRRRVKAGIDIQIDEFLRGVKTVEMNGTLFTVKAPK